MRWRLNIFPDGGKKSVEVFPTRKMAEKRYYEIQWSDTWQGSVVMRKRLAKGRWTTIAVFSMGYLCHALRPWPLFAISPTDDDWPQSPKLGVEA